MQKADYRSIFVFPTFSKKNFYIFPIVFFASTLIFLGLQISTIDYPSKFVLFGTVDAAKAEAGSDGPTFKDPNLAAEVVYEGLKEPTAMDFLGQDDILVLEKSEGTV
ncbi:MAG: hypothetical protein AB7P56_06540, partial [Nitrososphaeraceae archaeon]